jgi:hypothetical protein
VQDRALDDVPEHLGGEGEQAAEHQGGDRGPEQRPGAEEGRGANEGAGDEAERAPRPLDADTERRHGDEGAEDDRGAGGVPPARRGGPLPHRAGHHGGPAAEKLGIGRATIYREIAQYGIQVNTHAGGPA